jgi:hypothetical protein
MPNTAPPARYDLLGDAPDGLVADKMVEVCPCACVTAASNGY